MAQVEQDGILMVHQKVKGVHFDIQGSVIRNVAKTHSLDLRYVLLNKKLIFQKFSELIQDASFIISQ